MDVVAIGPLAGLRVIARRPWLLLVWWAFGFVVLWATWRTKTFFLPPAVSPIQITTAHVLSVIAANMGGAIVFIVAMAMGLMAATRMTITPTTSNIGGLRLGRSELRLLPVTLAVGLGVSLLSAALTMVMIPINRQWAEAIVGLPVFGAAALFVWKFAFAPAIAIEEPTVSPFRSWSMTGAEGARIARVMIPACCLCLLIFLAYRLAREPLRTSLLERDLRLGTGNAARDFILWQTTLYSLATALIWPILASPAALLFAERQRKVAEVF